MEIRILNLSNIKGLYHILSARDRAAMHLGYYWMNGKVTYTMNILITTQPDYVLLTVEADEKNCYLCHVEDAKSEYEIIHIDRIKEFKKYLPKHHDDRNKVWLLFDSIQKLPIEFIDEVLSDNTIKEFINSRADNKGIG